jgi:hypothetical protein
MVSGAFGPSILHFILFWSHPFYFLISSSYDYPLLSARLFLAKEANIVFVILIAVIF